MIRLRFLAAGIALVLAAADGAAVAGPPTRPKLIVQITFDQLRADLLDRYRPAFSHGFRRVLDGGRWFRRGDVAHGQTNSFPGHATLATGLFPSRHGLTANEWWVEKDGRWTEEDVVEDRRYAMVGEPGRVGVSPHNILASALADWVKGADPAAKAVVLGTGGTIAVAYGGRHPDAAYWYDGALGRFTTSTYYAAAPHDWIRAFNERDLQSYKRPVWALTVPRRFRPLAAPDPTPYESNYEGNGVHNVFPHFYAVESRPPPSARSAPPAASDPATPNGRAFGGGAPAAAPPPAAATPYGRWFGGTPLKDEGLFALAARAVDSERLGRRGPVDYLAILPDSTDGVGHRFGPSSLEQLDTLLRLDRALGRFLDHLDLAVGRNNYILAISADHGVADPPEEHGLHRISNPEIEAVLDRVEAIASAHKGTESALVDKILADLRRADFIADAYSEDRLASPLRDDPYAELYKRAFRKGRTPDFPLWTRKARPHHPARYGIIVRFKPGMIFDEAAAVHGSPYAYDRSVPIVFYGAGVKAGAGRGGRTVDVAPTLADLAGVAVPADLDGIPLPVRRGR